MTILTTDRGVIVMTGSCPSDDAELLLQRLLATPTATVDLTACTGLHAAVIQVLLAAAPQVRFPSTQSEPGDRLRSLLRSLLNAEDPAT